MKYIVPAITGVISAKLGYGIDTEIFWLQASAVAIIIALLP